MEIVHPRVVRHSFMLSVSFVWSFFIDRPFGYRQFFARRRGSQVRGHEPRNWSGILREYPFWRQNAEGCRQNSRPTATVFLGVVPGLPTFVPRISWVPDGQRTSKRRKLHTKTRDRQEPTATIIQSTHLIPKFGIKISFRKFSNLNYFRTFIGDNQIVTNSTKRLPNDLKGQGYRNFQYYWWVL